MPEFDGPWKEFLTALFRYVLSFYRPEVAAKVDWEREMESLETELQKLLPSSQTGVQRIDKLFKVWLLTGEVRYFHVEIQCWVDANFPFRVYVYNATAELYFGEPIDSLIILGDKDPTWVPHSYSWERSCSKKSLTFEPLKLLQWQAREAELLADDNPFALFVVTHNQVWATEGDNQTRADVKLRLLQRACSLKMSVEAEVNRHVLLRMIDWLLPLPAAFNAPIWENIRLVLEGPSVPFVAYFEREAHEAAQKAAEKAAEKAAITELHRGIAMVLRVRFKAEGEALSVEVKKQTDVDWLRRFMDSCETATLDELRKLLP